MTTCYRSHEAQTQMFKKERSPDFLKEGRAIWFLKAAPLRQGGEASGDQNPIETPP
jgi:hypothetical protein